jgi:hypothetical protein
MIALVHFEKRTRHCDGEQCEENDLEWNENGGAFSSPE